MSELVIVRGLPASGKTTWAKRWVAEHPTARVRVNRDDLRQMLHNGVYISGKGREGTEQTVIRLRDVLIDEALCSGRSVVCDDTNLPSHTVKDLLKIAKRVNATVQVIDLTDVDPAVCEARNSLRTDKKPVPAHVIWDMYNRYVNGKRGPLPVPVIKEVAAGNLNRQPYIPDTSRPIAIIVDLDGTIAHMNGRSPYDYSLVSTDNPDPVIVEMVDSYCWQLGYSIVFLSGRKADCRTDTVNWLKEHVILPDYKLFMRAEGDNRNDALVKYELFDEHVRKQYNVRFVLDDRDRVVEMWRSIGIKCLQVAPGDF